MGERDSALIIEPIGHRQGFGMVRDRNVLVTTVTRSLGHFFERRPAHQSLAATGYDGVQRLVHATAYPLFGTTAEMHGVVSVFWQVDHEETGA